MDDRQTQIREGAGLEDSRLNKDFIEFLNKWSSPVLMVLAVAALVYAGLGWMERKKNAQIDQAFNEYESAIAGGNPSPSSLKTIATEPSNDQKSVPELAQLRAADIYLQSFIVGVAPGAQLDPLTGTYAETDLLDDTKREQYLEEARKSAQAVLDETDGKPAKIVLTMQAVSRLASVAEGKRDFAGARSYYERLQALGEQQQFEPIVAFAKERIANLGTLESIQPLPTNADVPPLNPVVETEQDETSLPTALPTTETGSEEPAPGTDPGETSSENP